MAGSTMTRTFLVSITTTHEQNFTAQDVFDALYASHHLTIPLVNPEDKMSVMELRNPPKEAFVEAMKEQADALARISRGRE
jgi:hypothetical protein